MGTAEGTYWQLLFKLGKLCLYFPANLPWHLWWCASVDSRWLLQLMHTAMEGEILLRFWFWAVKLPGAVPPPRKYCPIKQQGTEKNGGALDWIVVCQSKIPRTKPLALKMKNQMCPIWILEKWGSYQRTHCPTGCVHCILCLVLQSLSPPSDASSPALVSQQQ